MNGDEYAYLMMVGTFAFRNSKITIDAIINHTFFNPLPTSTQAETILWFVFLGIMGLPFWVREKNDRT